MNWEGDWGAMAGEGRGSRTRTKAWAGQIHPRERLMVQFPS